MVLMMPVDRLEVGMYVAQLDRPWLDTPFLFQGFYIRSKDEIDEIKAHCEHVYVSRESVLSEEATATPPAKSENAGKQALKRRFEFRGPAKQSNPPTEEPNPEHSTIIHPETATLKEEMSTAAGVQKHAITAVKEVMAGLKSSGNLDLERVETTVTPMVDSVLRNPAALACLMRLHMKDNYLYHHSLASSVWATILGRQIGLSREDLVVVGLGAMLLDVGKTLIPDEILSKPDKLNADELKVMRKHVELGLGILQKSGKVDPRVLDMVAHHHERYNGTGYPAGHSGNDIPVFGRIAGIVDAYDAMITPRPYAKLMSSYDALRKLRVLADVEFQAEIVEQFTRAIGVFPTGTLVELSTGEVAIVTRQNRIRRLRPEVMVIMGADKELLDDFRIVDLNEETVAAAGEQSLWIEHGLPPGSHGIDPTEFYLD